MMLGLARKQKWRLPAGALPLLLILPLGSATRRMSDAALASNPNPNPPGHDVTHSQ